jgi:hypothetical protein
MPSLPDWLICEDVDGERTFVYRSAAPRCFCEIFDEGDAPARGAKPVHKMADGRSVGGIVWIDEAPADADLTALARQAAEAIETYEENLEADFADDEY